MVRRFPFWLLSLWTHSDSYLAQRVQTAAHYRSLRWRSENSALHVTWEPACADQCLYYSTHDHVRDERSAAANHYTSPVHFYRISKQVFISSGWSHWNFFILDFSIYRLSFHSFPFSKSVFFTVLNVWWYFWFSALLQSEISGKKRKALLVHSILN